MRQQNDNDQECNAFVAIINSSASIEHPAAPYMPTLFFNDTLTQPPNW